MVGSNKYTLGFSVLKAFGGFFSISQFWETVLNWEITRFIGWASIRIYSKSLNCLTLFT